jgi:hypothetical protein
MESIAYCNMQYAICNMQYAICNMQYAILLDEHRKEFLNIVDNTS